MRRSFDTLRFQSACLNSSSWFRYLVSAESLHTVCFISFSTSIMCVMYVPEEQLGRAAGVWQMCVFLAQHRRNKQLVTSRQTVKSSQTFSAGNTHTQWSLFGRKITYFCIFLHYMFTIFTCNDHSGVFSFQVHVYSQSNVLSFNHTSFCCYSKECFKRQN